MPTYKLTYFNVRALGEPIRMILTYMGVDFEDVRLTFDEWLKIKSTTPFGKLPMLEIDGKVLTQSAAICRYLAFEAGLAGSNSWENLQIDTIVDTFTDFRKEISAFHHEADPEKKEAKRAKLLNEVAPYYLQKFDEIVKENNGYLANGKLSWADIYLAGFSDSMTALLQVDLWKNYSNLTKWKNQIYNIPAIKGWLEKRPETHI